MATLVIGKAVMSSLPADANAPASGLSAATRPPTPGWVKVFAAIGGVVLLVIIVVLVANMAGIGIEHGPGRHFGGNNESNVPPTNETQPTATEPEPGSFSSARLGAWSFLTTKF